jgi:5-methyltetrahydropteroyltriglutamate--homocysteine methyltransferase
MPKHRKVVLGLVSTKAPRLENKDFLKKRIDEAAKYFPLENLAISPQCGFASHSCGSALSFEQQEAKLRRVVETAREVWGA